MRDEKEVGKAKAYTENRPIVNEAPFFEGNW